MFRSATPRGCTVPVPGRDAIDLSAIRIGSVAQRDTPAGQGTRRVPAPQGKAKGWFPPPGQSNPLVGLMGEDCHVMTNSIAIGLGLFIIAAFAVNFAMGWDGHIFLARKLADAIEWLAFWR